MLLCVFVRRLYCLPQVKIPGQDGEFSDFGAWQILNPTLDPTPKTLHGVSCGAGPYEQDPSSHGLIAGSRIF